MLLNYAVRNRAVGYCQGMSYIATLLLFVHGSPYIGRESEGSSSDASLPTVPSRYSDAYVDVEAIA